MPPFAIRRASGDGFAAGVLLELLSVDAQSTSCELLHWLMILSLMIGELVELAEEAIVSCSRGLLWHSLDGTLIMSCGNRVVWPELHGCAERRW